MDPRRRRLWLRIAAVVAVLVVLGIVIPLILVNAGGGSGGVTSVP